MNKLLLALAAACFAVMLAMPVHAQTRVKPAGLDSGNDGARATDVSSQRRYHRRHYAPRRAHWGPRRAYWGPRRHWGPRYRHWAPRRAYWGPRRAWWGPRPYWGPRPVYWGPRYYWRPRPVFWGPAFWAPRYRYWGGGPAISIGFGFGPRWGW